MPIITYFEKNYVIGRPARGRRRAVQPKYPIELWNQYDATIRGAHRTNNISEAWHNRFRIVVGRHHLDLYSALTELQKEQADVESQLLELQLGKSNGLPPKNDHEQ